MSEVKLGRLCSPYAQRDAIHIAVVPMVATEELEPGQHIGVTEDGKVSVVSESVGIVDPFLKQPVKAGERFYLCLYTGTVTSMKHYWTHPAFKDAEENNEDLRKVAESELRKVAEAAGLSLEGLIDGAERYLRWGDYLIEGGRWDGFYTPEDFWDHYEVYTGKTVAEDDRGNFFSCTC